jgi:hypothetical protein
MPSTRECFLIRKSSPPEANFGAGLPDGIFSTKNHNLGKFWMAFEWKMLIFFMAILEYFTAT